MGDEKVGAQTPVTGRNGWDAATEVGLAVVPAAVTIYGIKKVCEVIKPHLGRLTRFILSRGKSSVTAEFGGAGKDSASTEVANLKATEEN